MRIRTVLIAAALSWLLPHATVTAKEDKTTLDDVNEEALDAAKTLGEYAADRKEEAISKANEMIEMLDGRIERLREDIRNASGEAQDRMRSTLSRLEWKRAKLAARTEELKKSSAEAWQDVKLGFISAFEELKTAYDAALEEFES